MATQEEIELDVKIDTTDDAVTEQLKEQGLGRRFWSSLTLLVIVILFYVIVTTVFRKDRIGRTTTTDYVFYFLIAILTIATIYFATFGRIRLKRRTRDIFYGGGVQLPEAIEKKPYNSASAKSRSETPTSSYQVTQADVAASETERKPNKFRNFFNLVKPSYKIQRQDLGGVDVVISELPPSNEPEPDIKPPSNDQQPGIKETRRKSTPGRVEAKIDATIPETSRKDYDYVPGTKPVQNTSIAGINMVSNLSSNLFPGQPTADGPDKNNQKQQVKQNLKPRRRGTIG